MGDLTMCHSISPRDQQLLSQLQQVGPFVMLQRSNW